MRHPFKRHPGNILEEDDSCIADLEHQQQQPEDVDVGQQQETDEAERVMNC